MVNAEAEVEQTWTDQVHQQVTTGQRSNQVRCRMAEREILGGHQEPHGI